MKLTDQVSDLSKRVGALESTDYNDAQTVARITKIYGNVRVTMTMRAYLHTYKKCGQIDVYFMSPIFPSEVPLTCDPNLIL